MTKNLNVATAVCGSILSALLFVFLFARAEAVINGQILMFGVPWAETLGVSLSFYIDGLSLLFGLIITGAGFLLFLYAASYFKAHPQGVFLNIVFILFMLSMLGLVTSDNIIAIFMFWELTTLTSYLLIGAQHREESVRKRAWQALIVTGGGGLVFLAGLILMGMMAGTYETSEIIRRDFTAEPLYVTVFTLLVIGCFTKSAQFPFHFWLPNAMAAPTPVSAYLHSATMVKAGLYFLARFSPALGGTNLWFWTLSIAGGITMVWASIVALRQTDLKLMMAYTTLMALGTITFLLGSAASEIAMIAAIAFLFGHALYKAALFLIIGNLEKASGTRNWALLGGWGKIMPLTMIAAALSCLSMAGVPPFIGFIGKELAYKGVLDHVVLHPAVAVCISLFSAVLIAGISFFLIRFLLVGAKPSQAARYVPLSMTLPPLILALIGIVFGLMPEFLMQPLIHAATMSVTGTADTIALELWHGFGTVFYLSVGTLAFGALVAWRFEAIHRKLDAVLGKLPVTGESIYNMAMGGVLALAARQTLLLQNGRQRSYILIVYTTLSVLVLGAFTQPAFFENMPWEVIRKDLGTATLYHWALFAFLVAAILTTIISRSRLLAICALGGMGTGIALMFAIFSAPDVAMTQFMTEILVVIIATFVIMHLPAFTSVPHGSRAGRARDLAVSLLTGGIVTIMMLAATSLPFNHSTTQYYEQHSYITAHGRNIVNVILVDFRALDTLGEILVVALAGLSCYALIGLKKGRTSA